MCRNQKPIMKNRVADIRYVHKRSARHVAAIVHAAVDVATSQRGSSGGSRAPDLGPFEVVHWATWLHVMRHVNDTQPAVRSVGGSAILSGARKPRGHTS